MTIILSYHSESIVVDTNDVIVPLDDTDANNKV